MNINLSEHVALEQEMLELEKLASEYLEKAQTKEEVEQHRVFFLGKKGKVSQILRKTGSLSADERPRFGQLSNNLKQKIETLIEEHSARIDAVARQQAFAEQIDITLPGRAVELGKRHPITQTAQAILSCLESLGFELAEGPEIEHDFFNFEALNVPKDHPARDMQDTFYVENDVVLRTQTSPVQIRAMLAQKELPMRVASFGRVYRRDQDVTHSPMFHQVEGLYVDRNVSFAQLKGTLTILVQQLFDKSVQLRLRPSFFPFTEPSCEVDISCFSCKGSGCRLCKMTGFIEILGAGMVDPEVFKAVGQDPETVSGFAFGIGVERVAMLRHGISDIRHFFDNDLRFLRQF